MTTYNQIAGRRVNFLSSDPTYVDTNSDGQVWYNSTTATLKSWLPTGTWSSGGNLTTSRAYVGSGGTQTATFIAGGQGSGGAPIYNNTELYNGIAWTNSGNINTSRQLLNGTGTQTAGLIFGGYTTTGKATEAFNGSTWTNEASLSSARQAAAEGNSATAALCVSGEGAPTAVEEWTGAGVPETKTITTS